MRFQFTLLIPLACALIYVLGALAVKRATVFGAGVWRASFLSNWALALIFVPVWFWQRGTWHAPADYWQPLVSASLFLIGQTLTFLALGIGDVSVVTPVLGTKVILVALFSSLLRAGDVPWRWWLGAGLSVGAILLLHSGSPSKHRNVSRTAVLAFGSAVAFGSSDVLLQKWLPAWGVVSFAPPMFLFAALLSVGFVPFFRAPLSQLSWPAWRWVLPGAVLMAFNNAGIVVAIALSGNATAVNIVYSVRGLLAVLLAWGLGRALQSEEVQLGGWVWGARLVAACLMATAIVLVLM
jgi:drug/metabolite transporter (DMT)-like permease